LVYLSNVEEATSQDLEIGSELRQPEVSIAMCEFKRLGWIDEREVRGYCDSERDRDRPH
jgi:predicted transcriptional regulator